MTDLVSSTAKCTILKTVGGSLGIAAAARSIPAWRLDGWLAESESVYLRVANQHPELLDPACHVDAMGMATDGTLPMDAAQPAKDRVAEQVRTAFVLIREIVRQERSRMEEEAKA
jgi:hypothetical protein